MVLLRTRLRVDPAQRAKVVRSLLRMIGPLRASAGCLSCQLYVDIEDADVLLLAQEWVGIDELREQLRADNARVLLSALECATDPPNVRLDTLADSRGMEFLAQYLDTGDPLDP